MAVNNLRGTVMNASKVPLLRQVIVRGYNSYTFGSNLLSWDEANNYLMTTVAETFGQVADGSDSDIPKFRCGDGVINSFDLGLLFSCFVGITTAYAEVGSGIDVASESTTSNDIKVVWFGNYGIVYSLQNNLVIPLKSSDIQKACRYDDIQVDNFNDRRVFALQREGLYLVLVTSKGELLCKLAIPVGIMRAYPQLFKEQETHNHGEGTPWDEDSQLGHLISGSMYITDATDTIRKYRERAQLDSVVVRDDLIFKPTERYGSTEELFGSICYTDKDTVCIAVNFRNNLFVYQPWFGGVRNSGEVQVDPAPQFGAFYNVTEECKQIIRYANSVTVVPLTAAQFDVEIFDRVRTAFFNLELPRIQFASTFGKIVIPEPVLLSGLASVSGETAYCIVPVGAIGKNVICKEPNGELSTIKLTQRDTGEWEPWGSDTAFYDITGVVL